MPLVKYVSNISPTDGTGGVKLDDHRVIYLGGAPLEVDDQELVVLKSRCVVEVIEDPNEKTEEETEEAVSVSPAPVSTSSTVTPSASVSSVSVGSTPSSPTYPTPPTPPAGN